MRVIPRTDIIVELMLTTPDAPRREPGVTHEFEPPHRWGEGTVYRVYKRAAVFIGRVEPNLRPGLAVNDQGLVVLADDEDEISREARLITLDEEEKVRLGVYAMDERIRRGYRPWYADYVDTVAYQFQTRKLRLQGKLELKLAKVPRPHWAKKDTTLHPTLGVPMQDVLRDIPRHAGRKIEVDPSWYNSPVDRSSPLAPPADADV